MKTFGRGVLRVLKWLGLALVVFVAVVVIDGYRAFGHAAEGARLARMQRSPQWKDGKFHNPQPLYNDYWGMLHGLFHTSEHVNPEGPVPTVTLDPRAFEKPPQSGLRVTWFGHSSILVEIDGHRFLTDPVWSERASPLSWLGPKRWFPPPIALEKLLPLDAVVISHDHYDHLDYGTIRALKDSTRFIVPLGIGAHLAYWGVPEERIIELDWWEKTKLGELEVVCTPARHASGRFLFDMDAKLWAGYAFVGPKHRAYYSGDTGLFPAMKQIGERLGPFDVTLIETGQYNRAWPDWHIGPEQAVEAHRLVRGRVMVPVHWGLLGLAYHGWTEPVERVSLAATAQHVQILTPKPGQSIAPTATRPIAPWWPRLSFETAAEAPIQSTNAR